MKLRGVETLGVQAPLELVVVPYIRSEFDFCLGICCPAIVFVAIAFLSLFAGARDLPASGFIRARCWAALWDGNQKK